jgi:hypothetical protein
MPPSAPDIDWTQPATIIIAFIALVQPWAISLYRRFLSRRKLSIVTSGRLEIAYCLPFGSFLALKGAIYSERLQTLVTSMSALVANDSTGESRLLRVHLFRDAKLTFAGTTMTVSAELAKPFIVEAEEVGQYYATFIDFADFRSLEEIGRRVMPLWSQYIATRTQALTASIGIRPADAVQASLFDQRAQQLILGEHSAFLNQPDIVPIVAEIESLFHWTQGNYHVTLSLDVEGDRRTFPTSWPFEITAEDEALLRSNVSLIMRGLCGSNEPTLPRYVYPEYGRASNRH